MHMTKWILVLFVGVCHLSTGQSLTISGKVQDRATQEVLPFASVGIKDKPISTITNLQGEFDFHLPAEYRNEILVISMLGYSDFEAPVWSLLATPGVQLIQMDKSATMLDEVVIMDTLTGGDILRIALSRIEKNYPMRPFLMDGFYRDVKKVGGTYISLLEAAVKIYDESYEEPRNKFRLRERVKLVEVRQSLGYENRFTAYFDQDNLLEDLLLHNNVRYRQFDMSDEFFLKLVRDRDSHFNGRPIFVISATTDYSIKLYIDKQDYGIVHFEYEIGFQDQVISKKKDLMSKFEGLKKSVDFKRFGKMLYPNFMSMTSKINWYDAQTGALKFETELAQQLLINDIKPNTSERISSTEKMRNYGLQYQDLPYNKAFWDNYNVIKETPLDKKILADLEKSVPLHKQFEN